MTPGSLPWDASILKQILQIPNFLINALGLPHMGHLLYALALNFGSFSALILSAFLAKSSSFADFQSLCRLKPFQDSICVSNF
jgi:hypothetical protein